MAGVIDVVVIPQSSVGGMLGETLSTEAVAVVADSYWTANEAVKTLQVTWSETGFESVDSDGIYAQFERDITGGTERQSDRVTGEVSAEFASAARVIDADYHVPFLAHTCMEPLNATADVKSDRAEIWSAEVGIPPGRCSHPGYGSGTGYFTQPHDGWRLRAKGPA